jgi:hypothetical protein
VRKEQDAVEWDGKIDAGVALLLKRGRAERVALGPAGLLGAGLLAGSSGWPLEDITRYGCLIE